jgi:hypothetical protein
VTVADWEDRISGGTGALVASVLPDGVASTLGICCGDLIVGLGSSTVRSEAIDVRDRSLRRYYKVFHRVVASSDVVRNLGLVWVSPDIFVFIGEASAFAIRYDDGEVP